VDYYDSLADEGLVRIVERRADVQELVTARTEGKTDTPLGLVLLMEGADPLRVPSELERWTERGLRIVGPAWNATRYCGGTGMPGGLTPDGRALMGELKRTGTLLDTSHMAEESFWQALRLYQGPIIASHSNCRRFVPTDRHLSDDMIRAIIDRDGIVGIVPFNRFLDARWTTDDPKSAVRLETLVRHVEHICELAHDTRHVGIGSDLDGGFGREGIPAELDSCADLPLIGHALTVAGWRADEVAAVLGGNWVRWLTEGLPA
jgi:membrane dipeptidase